MGDVSEMVLDGILCSGCGGIVDSTETEAPGYPRYCEDCKKDEELQEEEQ